MIPESRARELHKQGVPVVQKGDKDWTSDADRERETAARSGGALQFYNGDKRPWAKRVDPDYGEFVERLDFALRFAGDRIFEPGTERVKITDGPDLLTFEYRSEGQWRFCYRERNAAL